MQDRTDNQSAADERLAASQTSSGADELSRRLRGAVDGVTVEPDLQTVELRANRLRRRRRVVSNVAAASLVAAAAGLGFGVGRSVDNSDSIASSPPPTSAPTSPSSPASTPPSSDDDSAAVSVTADDSAASTASTVSTSLPSEDGAASDVIRSAPVPDSMLEGDMVWISELEQVYERTVNGDRIRVQVGQPWESIPEEGPFGSWQPGEGCAFFQARVTIDGPSVVDVGVTQLTSGLFADPLVESFPLGAGDARPLTLWLFRSSPDAVTVSTTFADGTTDRADFVNGYAVLVGPQAQEAGPNEPDTTVEVTRADGSVASYPIAVLSFWDDPDFLAACSPPPPSLPDAGVQPADPAAAKQDITAAFDRLWDTAVDRGDKVDLLDDWTGVDAALDQVLEGDFAETAELAVHRIDELVFTAPDEVWFRYTIETDVTSFGGRYGYARLVDGHWQFPRELMCQDLSLAGGQCGYGWEPITTPGSALTAG